MPDDGDTPRGRRFLGTDRLAAFSDGVFSMPATLLVLEIAVIRRAHRWLPPLTTSSRPSKSTSKPERPSGTR